MRDAPVLTGDGDDEGGRQRSKVAAGITTSLDGYITGPNDGPGRGWARAASDCTTGFSAGRGATSRSHEASRRARTSRYWTRRSPASAPWSAAATPTRRRAAGTCSSWAERTSSVRRCAPDTWRSVDLDRAGCARGREAAVRWLPRDDGPGAPAAAPVTIRHAHHLSRRALTCGGRD